MSEWSFSLAVPVGTYFLICARNFSQVVYAAGSYACLHSCNYIWHVERKYIVTRIVFNPLNTCSCIAKCFANSLSPHLSEQNDFGWRFVSLEWACV